MTRQELAESMAVFLGVQIIQGEWYFDKTPDTPFRSRLLSVGAEDYEAVIFTPDGFFAVWDKLGELDCITAYDTLNKAIWDVRVNKEDRHTAFYSAVHELNQRSGEG